MPASEQIRAPRPLLVAARDIFLISVERMLPRARSLWVFLLLALPVFLGVLLKIYPPKGLPLTAFELYGVVIALFFVRNLLPLVALLFGSALISDAVESKTITYYLTLFLKTILVL